jgi:uncharacterized protein
MDDAAEPMRARLQADLRAALKARNKLAVSVLRALIAAIDNAGAIALQAPGAHAHPPRPGGSQYVVAGNGKTEAARKPLNPQDIETLLASEAGERRAAADQVARHGKHEEAAALRLGADLIETYRLGSPP